MKITEAQIHASTIAHWRALGLPGTLVATIPNQFAHGQTGLTRGLPDLIIIAPGLPVGFIELKTDKGRVNEAQTAFKARCIALGIPHAITRGRDEPIKVLEAWKVVRAA